MNCKALIDLAMRRMPGGVSTNVRLTEGPHKLIVNRAHGTRIWTVDGRELVDFVCGFGSILLGYGFASLTQRQAEVLANGVAYNATNPFEIEAADRLLTVFPAYDKVRFCVTGSEATTAAIGLARAATDRRAIAVFKNHYHGWHGPTKATRTAFPTLGPAAAIGEVFELPFNNPQVCADFFRLHGDSLAGVIFEIVMMNGGGYEPAPEFISVLHQARDRCGFLLIADEVITGFRVGLHGAQGKYGVHPDLTVFGKALGGGLPLAAVVGRSEHMDLFASGKALHAGTFNGHPLCAASAAFMLEYLSANEKDVYTHIERVAQRLQEGLRIAATEAGLVCRLRGSGPVMCLEPGNESSKVPALQQELQDELLAHGIRVPPGGRWFVGYAHSIDDVGAAVTAAKNAFHKLKAADSG
ncbi:MAG: aminotransferase class III-fold pyridoxal phosphate-dependent enzyme [Terriglobales bacterium]|jgi:glutamate-1-semialdehyde 2,1-aminomutase